MADGAWRRTDSGTEPPKAETGNKMDNFGFLKVAAAIPSLRVGDCTYNMERTAALAEEAARRGVEIAAFPELGITAYTCADLLLQPTLLDAAEEAGVDLRRIATEPFELSWRLPWEHVSPGESRGFLEREWRRALAGKTTEDCTRASCTGCGICPTLHAKNVLMGDRA